MEKILKVRIERLILVTNYTLSVPTAYVAVDMLQWPRRLVAWEIPDVRMLETIRILQAASSHVFLWPWLRDDCKHGSIAYGYPTAPAESLPSHPRSGEPITPLQVSRPT